METLGLFETFSPLGLEAMSKPAHPYDEVEREYIRYWQLGAVTEDWNTFSDLYTEDAILVSQEQGTVLRGKEAIRAWLLPTMNELIPELYTVYAWHMIKGNLVVNGMINRRDNPEPGAPPIDFHGVTVQVYAGDGLWSYQEDYYSGVTGGRALELYESQRKAFDPKHREKRTRLCWGDGPDWSIGAASYQQPA